MTESVGWKEAGRNVAGVVFNGKPEPKNSEVRVRKHAPTLSQSFSLQTMTFERRQ